MVDSSGSEKLYHKQFLPSKIMQDYRNLASPALSREAGGTFSKSGKLKIPHAVLRYGLAIVDAGLIVIASLAGSGSYQFWTVGTFANADQFLGAGVIAAILYVLIGKSGGFYDLHSALQHRRRTGRIATQWTLVVLLLTLLAFLMKVGPAFSRGSILCFYVTALILLLTTHRTSKRLIAAIFSDAEIQGRRGLVLGTSDELASLDGHVLLQSFGISELGRFVLPSDAAKKFAFVESDTSVVEKVIEFARQARAEEIVLALPWSDPRQLELLRDYLRSSPLPVQLLPDRRVRSLGGNPAFRRRENMVFEIQRGPLTRSEQLAKRLLDIVGASIGLVAVLPIFVFAALAIKLDSSGPILFRQRRNGFNAQQFLIFKFRTMSVMEDGSVVTQATRRDPRVTRVGRILRRTSIDELPQLINVLLGHMSLVGPRPHALAHDSHYGRLLADYAFRHHVKPGITGWAQVRGFRGETERVEQMKGRVDCDLWYINNWSLSLDVRILLLTLLEVTRRRNAY